MTDLYLITPPVFELQTFKKTLAEVLDTGAVKVLQLRMKSPSSDGFITGTPNWDEVKKAANELISIVKDRGVAFILNDNPKLAMELGFDGVHLGDEDISVKDARKLMGDNYFIGASCYASKDRAFTAGEEGASYVAFGAFYETQTKKPKGRPTPELIRFWAEFTNIPCVAIGGITPENAAPIVEACADYIAVVNGVWKHEKGPQFAALEYRKLFDKYSSN